MLTAWHRGFGNVLRSGSSARVGACCGFPARWGVCPPTAAPEARRLAVEMEEVAGAFAYHGLPQGFHTGAAEVYRAPPGAGRHLTWRACPAVVSEIVCTLRDASGVLGSVGGDR